MTPTADSERVIESLGGVWLCHYVDWSALAVFATELEARRYAMEHSMEEARWCPWGEVKQ
ncbi:MAG TPA: hypothetical protein VLL25_18035 [Acidimicrobiales bacterium]|nr:hypothetical protein [Acidimicrobiales bacterium]